MGIRVVHQGPVSDIVLSLPERRNALDAVSGRALAEAVEELRLRESTKVVVLRGDGGAFCAGGDVKAMAGGVRDGRGEALLREIAGEVHRAVVGIARMPKPVLAAVHGQAYGAGFSLALACDFVIAAEDAVFCQAFVKLGATPDTGSTYFLPRMVGRHLAAELIMLGRPVDAREAHRLGVVNRVVSPDDLDREVRQLAAELAAGPAQTYARAKHLLAVSEQSTLEQQLEEERRSLGESASTADFREGVEAFVAKRPADFAARRPGA